LQWAAIWCRDNGAGFFGDESGAEVVRVAAVAEGFLAGGDDWLHQRAGGRPQVDMSLAATGFLDMSLKSLNSDTSS
jgi:hypothetical protein